MSVYLYSCGYLSSTKYFYFIILRHQTVGLEEIKVKNFFVSLSS